MIDGCLGDCRGHGSDNSDLLCFWKITCREHLHDVFSLLREPGRFVAFLNSSCVMVGRTYSFFLPDFSVAVAASSFRRHLAASSDLPQAVYNSTSRWRASVNSLLSTGRIVASRSFKPS